MPHPTMLVDLTAMGPTYPMCGPLPPWLVPLPAVAPISPLGGPLPPVFTCPYFHTQYLYIPGASPTPQPGAGYVYAPVVNAAPGASAGSLDKAFGKFMTAIGSEVGKGAVQALFGQAA